MMNFVLKTSISVPKLMNCVFKTRNPVSKNEEFCTQKDEILQEWLGAVLRNHPPRLLDEALRCAWIFRVPSLRGNMYAQQGPQFPRDSGVKLCIHIVRSRYLWSGWAFYYTPATIYYIGGMVSWGFAKFSLRKGAVYTKNHGLNSRISY